MKEYIERAILLEELRKIQGSSFSTPLIIERIEKAPAADVVPVRHAYWEWRPFYGELGLMLCCSNCRETRGANTRFEYCPHCGAKMQEG